MGRPSKEQLMWNFERLLPPECAMWEALAASAEDNFFIWAKHFCDLEWLDPVIHEPICRFMSAPILRDNMPDAVVAEVDWVPSLTPIKRGAMRAGDPFGEPYQRFTRLSDPPKKRQLIRLPRGAFKTSLVGAMILWLLRRNINKSVMVMAADDDASNKILYYCDRHIRTNPKLRHYWNMDKWISTGDTWTVMRKFIATRTVNRANDPSIWSTSPGSVKAGPHPDYVFIDDTINEKILNNDAALEKAFQSYDLLSPMLMEDSIVWVTGTPWTIGDLYESLARRRISNTEYMFDVYTRDAVNPDGTFWFPGRMGEKFLKSKWIEAQESAPPKPWMFFSQYRMLPTSEAEQSLMLENIKWVMQDEVDKMMPRLRKIGGVDPADEKLSSGSWALWAMGTDADKGFWDIDLQKCSAKSKMVKVIARWAVQWGLEVLIIENTVISRRLIDNLREELMECGSRCAIETVEPHSISKARRIMEVENSGLGAVMTDKDKLHLRDNNIAIKNEIRTFPGGTYTYDALDIGSYITAWVMAHKFYPRKTPVSPKPSTLDPWMAKHRAECEQALAERDRKECGDFVPEYEEPGVVSYT